MTVTYYICHIYSYTGAKPNESTKTNDLQCSSLGHSQKVIFKAMEGFVRIQDGRR